MYDADLKHNRYAQHRLAKRSGKPLMSQRKAPLEAGSILTSKLVAAQTEIVKLGEGPQLRRDGTCTAKTVISHLRVLHHENLVNMGAGHLLYTRNEVRATAARLAYSYLSARSWKVQASPACSELQAPWERLLHKQQTASREGTK